MGMRSTLSRAVALVVTAAICTTLGSGAAFASEPDDVTTAKEAATVVDSIFDAVPAAVASSTADVTTLPNGATTSVDSSGGSVTVSDQGSGGVTVVDPSGQTVGISASIPDNAVGRVVGGMTVFDLGDHAVAYQPVAEEDGGGVRTLFTLEDASAPTTFEVNFDLPDGAKLVASEGGSVLAVGADGQTVGAVPAPWAKDANGRSVPTAYEIRGETLVQHVYPGTDSAYPIVADPFWIPAWAVVQIIRCGFGGYLGYIAAAGWRWYARALAVVGGCLIGMR